jgi:hypothetical protein
MLVLLPRRFSTMSQDEWCSIVARLLQNGWKMMKKWENRVWKIREICVQFVHVFLIWRVRWLFKITLICIYAKSVISRHLRAKWRNRPLEFTFLRLFMGCRLRSASTFGEGTIGEGPTQYHLKKTVWHSVTLTFDHRHIESQWNFNTKSISTMDLV